VDPNDYVYTPDLSHMVVLLDGTDSRAWRIWDVVLEQFRDMGWLVLAERLALGSRGPKPERRR